MNSTAKKLLAVLDRAVPQSHDMASAKDFEAEFANLPAATSDFYGRLSSILKFSVPDDDRKRLVDLQVEWTAIAGVIAAHVPRKAREAFLEQTKDLRADIGAPGVTVGRTLSIEEISGDYQRKMSAAKQAIKTPAEAAFKIIEPHLNRFASEIEVFANKVDADDRDVSEALLIPHTPSGAVLMLFKAAHQLRKRKQNFSRDNGMSPGEIASMIPNKQPTFETSNK